jgi:hypothetical protein
MRAPDPVAIDLTPPDFAEGPRRLVVGQRHARLADLRTGAQHVRIAVGDPDFGTCLEMRKIEPVQRLRYMAELPVRHAASSRSAAG